jgi:RNA polymerase sigma factor (sigma-70 family)
MTSAQAGLVLQHLRRLAGAPPDAQPPDAQLLECFTTLRDEAAFAALVRRHGPMVLNVCRSVLHHEQDAEDAFQATFLVLARKAASLRQPAAVAGWLYEVAYHVALKAQADTARRRAQERKVTPMAPADPTLDMTLRDLHRVLHEELRRLPDKYRLPLVLCYLEGRSQAEAAGQLGWSKGTLRGRLDRGREHLRRRLAARGVALSALLCATVVVPKAAAEVLADSVVQAAVFSAVDGPVVGALSTRAAVLAEGVIRAMFLGKLKVALAVLLAVGLVAGAGALARPVATAGEQRVASPNCQIAGSTPKTAATEAAPPATVDDSASVAYGGRVLGPDGQPVAGAKVYLTAAIGYLKRPSPTPAYATTGSDGRFRFAVPKVKFDDRATIITAAAANLGPGWAEVLANGPREELTLRLVEDAPITGQIVDLEGKPVAGASLTVLQINAASNEDPGPWLKAVKGKKGLSLEFAFEQRYLPRFTVAPAPKVTTDAAGRFRLTGIGRNRLIRVQLDGPTIASQQMYVLTRPGKAIEVPLIDADPVSGTPGVAITCYPVSFRHVAGSTQLVVGIVRDKDTGKPLPGVTVESYRLANSPLAGRGLVRTTTDEKGGYRLIGLPKGKGNKILVIPAEDQPYLETVAEIPDSPGFEPVTVDFRLKRGIWIEGRLTDKATGRPAPGEVCYLARIGNKFVRDYTGYEPLQAHANVHQDGKFRVVGLPGPGLLAVVRSGGYYLSARERDDAEGTRDTATRTIPLRVSTEGFVAQALIDPPQGAATFRRDVALDPGQTLTGTVLGPDGRPLAGARVYRLTALGWERTALKTASFTVRAFNPRRPRPVLFLHPEKRLVGVLAAPADKSAPVRVQMGTGATVTGRLVDADGLPRANVELLVGMRDRSLDMWVPYYPDTVRTDRDGRFRIEALLPDQRLWTLLRDRRFLLSDGRGGETYFGDGLRAGETTNLGDVRLKRAGE